MRVRSQMVVYAWVLVVWILAILLGHRLPTEEQQAHWVTNVELPGPFAFPLNFDSITYLYASDHPEWLLLPGKNLQSRPGLPLLGAALSRLIRPAADLVPSSWLGLSRTGPRTIPPGGAIIVHTYLASFLAFVLINAALVLLAVYLYAVLVGSASAGSLAVGCLLIVNDVTKAFVLTPHPQMFNILVPVFLVWVSTQARGAQFWSSRMIGLALLSGLGMLAYATFALFLPLVTLARLVSQRAARREDMARLAGLGAVLAMPTAIWFCIVYSLNGSYYNPEIANFQQFVWMGPALEQGLGACAAKLGSGAWSLLVDALRQGWVTAVLAVLLRPAKLGPALAVSLLFWAFFALSGYVPARLAYTLVPPLVCVVGAELASSSRRTNLVAVALMAAYVAQEWAKAGPYS